MSKNIILSPHYDDAIFSCFALLQNKNTLLLNVFSAEPNSGKKTLWDAVCGQANSRKMMKLRKRENQMATDEIGVKSIDLNFLENQYRSRKIDQSDICNKILDYVHSDDTIYAPLALGRPYSHPDHKLIRDAAVYLHKNKQIKVSFYLDIPYMRFPKKIISKYIKKLEKRALNLGLNLKANITELDISQLDKKIKISKLYKTQYFATNLVSLGYLDRSIKSKKEVYLINKI